MIRATGRDKDGNPIFLLGLSGENITRLVAGEPIAIEMAGVKISIIYGKTEEDILKDLKKAGIG